MAIISIGARAKIEILTEMATLFDSARLVYTVNGNGYGNTVGVTWDVPVETTDDLELSNSSALVFNIDAGVTVDAIIVHTGSLDSEIKIVLDDGPFTFTNAGKFTIPIGDLTISVAQYEN